MSEDRLTKDEELTEDAPEESAESASDAATPEADAPASLEEQLAQAQAQADEYLDGWQRAVAELSNFKKRVERERSDIHASARVAVMARFLDVLDDFERALENAPETLGEGGWFEGLSLVHRKFVGLLESEGVSIIEAEGQMFDPALHDAISQEPSEDHDEGQIIEVLQKGYMLGEKVVRPARVRVAG